MSVILSYVRSILLVFIFLGVRIPCSPCNLLIATTDGKMHLLSCEGKFFWSSSVAGAFIFAEDSDSPRMDISADRILSSLETSLQPFKFHRRLAPSYDGQLYLLELHTSTPISLSMSEVVSKVPFVSPLFPHNYFIGGKQTDVLNIDFSNGEELGDVCPDTKSLKTEVNGHLKIGRNSWTLVAVNSVSNQEDWRIQWIEFVSLNNIDKQTFNYIMKPEVEIKGRILTVKAPQGDTSRFTFASSILSVFVVYGDNELTMELLGKPSEMKPPNFNTIWNRKQLSVVSKVIPIAVGQMDENLIQKATNREIGIEGKNKNHEISVWKNPNISRFNITSQPPSDVQLSGAVKKLPKKFVILLMMIISMSFCFGVIFPSLLFTSFGKLIGSINTARVWRLLKNNESFKRIISMFRSSGNSYINYCAKSRPKSSNSTDYTYQNAKNTKQRVKGTSTVLTMNSKTITMGSGCSNGNDTIDNAFLSTSSVASLSSSFVQTAKSSIEVVSKIPQSNPLSTLLENGRYDRTFKTMSIIGKGSFGAVYEAKHKLEKNNPTYATKFVYLETSDFDLLTLQNPYLLEISANRDLFSHHVVRYYTWWCEEPHFLPIEDFANVEFETGIRYKSDAISSNSLCNDIIHQEGIFHQGRMCHRWEETSRRAKMWRSRLRKCELYEHSDFSESDGVHSVDISDSHESCQNACKKRRASNPILSRCNLDGNENDCSIEFRYDSDKVRSRHKHKKNEIIELNDYKSMIDQRKGEIESREKNNSAQIYKIVIILQMEICRGVTLREWIDSRENVTASADRCLELCLFKQLIKGLRDIHSKGIAHRDIKPDNMFIDKSNFTLKIGDFGLAAYRSETSDISEDEMRSGTVGTPMYCAPEGGKFFGDKADIYAAALILLELLHPPFPTQMERIETLQRFRRHQEVSNCVRVYPFWHRIIVSMTAAQPEKRPCSQTLYNMIKFKSLLPGCHVHQIV